ncbi:MAG: helix-turn-helix domain-containing protein [Pseudonocardiaceae bacterium]
MSEDHQRRIDPALLERRDVLGFLNGHDGHDIGGLYRVLRAAGWSQRQIARATGQSQSEVGDITAGRRRRVDSYRLLVRIAKGLGIPPWKMSLSCYDPEGNSHGPDGTYPGRVTVAEADEADMLRRQFQHLLALGAAAAVGGPVPEVGELAADLPAPDLLGDLPSRIGMVDVAVIRGYREQLGLLARTHGGQARAAVALTNWADHWLTVDASDLTHRALLGELAHLHTITAWCCHECGAVARALYHFGRAVELATEAGDAYQTAYALRYAGSMLVGRERPNDALKAIELGSVRLLDAPRDDPRVPVLGSWCDAVSALALSRLDDSQSVLARARDGLARAWDGWVPPDDHAEANMHLISASTWLNCGQLDAAAAAAELALRTFGAYRRGGVVADITRARLHVLTGDPAGLRLAASAIKATTQTRSGVARQISLPPLADALEARRGSDYRELARLARQVAMTRV